MVASGRLDDRPERALAAWLSDSGRGRDRSPKRYDLGEGPPNGRPAVRLRHARILPDAAVKDSQRGATEDSGEDELRRRIRKKVGALSSDFAECPGPAPDGPAAGRA